MKSKAKVVIVGGGVVGVISVSVAAYLMYILGWRDADDDE